MLKSKKFLSLSLSFLLLSLPVFLFAEEEITITTYYPSPYGVYNELQLYPHDPAVTTCDDAHKGTMFYKSTDDQIYVCKGATLGWKVSAAINTRVPPPSSNNWNNEPNVRDNNLGTSMRADASSKTAIYDIGSAKPVVVSMLGYTYNPGSNYVQLCVETSVDNITYYVMKGTSIGGETTGPIWLSGMAYARYIKVKTDYVQAGYGSCWADVYELKLMY